MTASELIDQLKQYPADLKIVVEGYENGFDDLETIKNVSLVLHPDKKYWDGKYDESADPISITAIALIGNRKYQ
jgi:hypothetical protein